MKNMKNPSGKQEGKQRSKRNMVAPVEVEGLKGAYLREQEAVTQEGPGERFDTLSSKRYRITGRETTGALVNVIGDAEEINEYAQKELVTISPEEKTRRQISSFVKDSITEGNAIASKTYSEEELPIDLWKNEALRKQIQGLLKGLKYNESRAILADVSRLFELQGWDITQRSGLDLFSRNIPNSSTNAPEFIIQQHQSSTQPA